MRFWLCVLAVLSISTSAFAAKTGALAPLTRPAPVAAKLAPAAAKLPPAPDATLHRPWALGTSDIVVKNGHLVYRETNRDGTPWKTTTISPSGHVIYIDHEKGFVNRTRITPAAAASLIGQTSSDIRKGGWDWTFASQTLNEGLTKLRPNLTEKSAKSGPVTKRVVDASTQPH